jgi:hypothetical protein
MIALMLAAHGVFAHSGPPFPLVATRIVGAYEIAVWTDPDTTNDGSAAGRFWVTLHPATAGTALPSDTRVMVSAASSDRPGETRSGAAEAGARDRFTYFAALVLDHEGPFRIHVAIDGPLGPAEVDAAVDATYDLRPARWLTVLYVMPFVLAGSLWIKLLVRRRRLVSAQQSASREKPM